MPEKGHHILMQAFVGFIHSGTDFFVTDAGLVGSETTIGDFFPFDKNGVPEFSRMRTAAQYALSIDEWCKIMEKDNNGGYANSWLIGDVNTNEIARLELGLKYSSLEKKKDGFFTGSNITEDLRILRFETKLHETDIKGSDVARRVRWNTLMKEYAGMINLELAEKSRQIILILILIRNSRTPGLYVHISILMKNYPVHFFHLPQMVPLMGKFLIQRWQNRCHL